MGVARGIAGRIREGLIVLAISLFLFVLLEGGLRLFWPQDVQTTYLNGLSLGVADPVLGFLLRPFSHTREAGPEYSVEYRIGREGHRDAISHTGPARPGRPRILLLGDSFTFGKGCDYGETWPVLLESDLRLGGHEVELIKAGIPGYDTRKEILYLERLLTRYSPDIVLLVFLPNDLMTNLALPAERAAASSPPGGGPSPIARAGGGTTRQAAAPEEEPTVAVAVATGEKRTDLHLVSLAKRLVLSSDRLYGLLYRRTARKQLFSQSPSQEIERKIEITQNLLSRGLADTAKTGAVFAVISLPQQFQVIERASAGPAATHLDVDSVDTIFTGFARARGFVWIPTLSALSERYRSRGADLYFRLDGHLNRAGNRAVADLLLPEVTQLLTLGSEVNLFTSQASASSGW